MDRKIRTRVAQDLALTTGDRRERGLLLDPSCQDDLSTFFKAYWMDGWMNGVLGHFYALSRLNWDGDNLG